MEDENAAATRARIAELEAQVAARDAEVAELKAREIEAAVKAQEDAAQKERQAAAAQAWSAKVTGASSPMTATQRFRARRIAKESTNSNRAELQPMTMEYTAANGEKRTLEMPKLPTLLPMSGVGSSEQPKTPTFQDFDHTRQPSQFYPQSHYSPNSRQQDPVVQELEVDGDELDAQELLMSWKRADSSALSRQVPRLSNFSTSSVQSNAVNGYPADYSNQSHNLPVSADDRSKSLFEKYNETLREHHQQPKSSLITKGLVSEGTSLKSPEAYAQPFCDFLTENPTVFHAVTYFEKKLEAAGFKKVRLLPCT